MGRWRCARKIRKLGKITAKATGAAHENPVAADIRGTPSLYLGDTLALALIRKELYRGGSWWATDPSECGRKLRDIARVLDELANAPKGPDGSEELALKLRRDREALATVGWLLMGKSLDEIRG